MTFSDTCNACGDSLTIVYTSQIAFPHTLPGDTIRIRKLFHSSGWRCYCFLRFPRMGGLPLPECLYRKVIRGKKLDPKNAKLFARHGSVVIVSELSNNGKFIYKKFGY